LFCTKAQQEGGNSDPLRWRQREGQGQGEQQRRREELGPAERAGAVAVRGPAVEAGAVEDVAAAPGAAHLGGGVEVAQADAAPLGERPRHLAGSCGGGTARRQRVEAHRRRVLLQALGGGGVARVVVRVGCRRPAVGVGGGAR